MPPQSIYGHPRTSKSNTTQQTTPSSSTLAFTTQLSSLISKDSNASNEPSTSRGRARPSKTPKSDIFSRPNRGAEKRAAADEDAYTGQVHQRSEDIGGVDAATLHRSKRRMEEKARIYDDLKSGLYLAGDSDDDEQIGRSGGGGGKGEEYLARLRRKEREGLVDFDKKWSDTRGESSDSSFEKDDEDGADDNASMISYEDELGRTRRGTRSEAAQASRLKAAEQPDPERWRPARPENLIHGATIQTHAFNPSATVASQMEYLASRRDKSPTPPEDTHYDPDAEVRTRGTGFYAFSKDENVRRKQMEELMNVREETQREREARGERRAHRERVKDERRRKIEELRSRRRADTFLAGLGDLGTLAGEG
ncbi:hypothetical protein PHISCL_09336 [Aspergillus sclerotialis]|uniref:Uncharacterized protein n=1 Tax=Aspergillus sclerotialis TaxID=2070753 RepID=A0A3A2ZG78_9EURO|nr:hypothetical protein PHISCL_09336 [Aspergillus sclerotialis]